MHRKQPLSTNKLHIYIYNLFLVRISEMMLRRAIYGQVNIDIVTQSGILHSSFLRAQDMTVRALLQKQMFTQYILLSLGYLDSYLL